MPILASDLAARMRSALDAEGAEHYRDDLDIIPAINSAVKWLESVVNISYGEKKIGEEIFQDLSVSGVFLTSTDSRISIDDFPEPIWTIQAVYPLPTTKGTGQPYIPPADDRESAYRPDLYFVSSDYDAKRLTVQEWISNKNNPFEAGYEGNAVCEDLADYAYLNPITHLNTGAFSVEKEIEIRPVINRGLVAVIWTKTPTPITSLNDFIEFPQQAFQILFDKALNYIAYKQGDQTTLYTVTLDDIRTLVTVFG